MATSNVNPIEQELESVYCLYAALARNLNPETGLGGKLFFAGEPTETGCRFLRAANIAGAASLATSADAPALRRAMREGALDFVVNSLDEALRILKNQIRKKQSVAVGVSLSPEVVAREMVERGVQPDLLASHAESSPELSAFVDRGARIVEPQPLPASLRIFPIPPDWNQPTDFDAFLLDGLAPGDHLNRRWVQLSPRYLPAAARRLRSIACDAVQADALFIRLSSATAGNSDQ